ncbi:hypothetical protein Q1695_004557 [Nippostrongylus brasiliensis]|nr:hypothetical protein Q1695_004557 [Nippostrongylus brasiliensis]
MYLLRSISGKGGLVCWCCVPHLFGVFCGSEDRCHSKTAKSRLETAQRVPRSIASRVVITAVPSNLRYDETATRSSL